MVPKIEALVGGLLLGEGPHWDVATQSLYFTDYRTHSIHKYVPATKKHTKATLGDHNVSIVIPVKGKKNEFIVTLDQKIAKVNWDGESPKATDIEVIFEVEKGSNHVINDGKCDASGRLWAGTMGTKPGDVVVEIPDRQGTLYSFEKNKKIKTHRHEVGISNGIAIDYKRKKFYYNDSYRKTIDEYDFDIETGTITNMRAILNLDNHGMTHGLCDGMTIDTDGNLWVAVFRTSSVIKVDPRTPETILETIKFPATYITSVAFGGPNLDELYVTSARFDPYEDVDGTLFRVTGLNVKGLPADEADLY